MSTDALAGLPRIEFVKGPTPLHPLPRLSAELGGPTIWAKRDDLTALAGGGNKARKLEFLFGDARALGADTVLTYGAVQSNHARMTAAAARMCGMEPVLCLSGKPPAGLPGNLLLDRILGARVVYLPDPDAPEAEAASRDIVKGIRQELESDGKTVYRIPVGGSNPLGNCGYVAAFDELLLQCTAEGIAPKAIACPVGSCGTISGLIAGAVLNNSATEIRGYAVVPEHSIKSNPLSIADLVHETGVLLGADIQHAASNSSVTYEHVGDGYGMPTNDCIAAITLAAQTEGLILDPVYTGKAMAGLMADIEVGRYRAGEDVVFLHTGGLPGLFPFESSFA